MKQSGFKKKTYEEVMAKLKDKPRASSTMRKTPLRARKPMKRGKMSVMGKTLRAELSADKEYTLCSLHGYQDRFGSCAGRVTREHALIYAGSKIQEKWAIPPICAQHHGVDLYQDSPGEAPKEVRVWVALNRATDEDLIRFSKAENYIRTREVLNQKYGPWTAPKIPQEAPRLA